LSARRALMTHPALKEQSERTIASPIPADAPVTTATLPARSPDWVEIWVERWLMGEGRCSNEANFRAWTAHGRKKAEKSSCQGLQGICR
jgi:hypothetical protein